MRWSATHGDPTGRRGRTGNDSGAAALEFALVLPVLLIVVFGLIDFGRMLNAQLIASDAAREGARAAAIVNAHEGETRIDHITASTIGGVTRTVTGCPADPAPTDFAEATVVVVFHWATPLGAILDSANVTLTGHSEMQCQR
ncbi:MAG: TadE/TadG family type IV pilus assembly protein [Micromonosporaceae bacterium]